MVHSRMLEIIQRCNQPRRSKKDRIHKMMIIILCEERKTPMSNPILITGAAGGQQGSTGRVIATLLLDQGLPVRAFVHKLDARSDELRQKGAEIIEGSLLNPASVQAAMKDVRRAYF